MAKRSGEEEEEREDRDNNKSVGRQGESLVGWYGGGALREGSPFPVLN